MWLGPLLQQHVPREKSEICRAMQMDLSHTFLVLRKEMVACGRPPFLKGGLKQRKSPVMPQFGLRAPLGRKRRDRARKGCEMREKEEMRSPLEMEMWQTVKTDELK